MLKTKYILYPDTNFKNIHEIKKFSEHFFNNLGYKVEFIDKLNKFHFYLNIENSIFEVTLRLLGPALVQYPIPLHNITTQFFGKQQIIIKKIQ